MNSLVFSNMLHRPARTLVSVLGIGVGILLIVFTIGLTNGTMRERAQRDSNVGAEILFRASGDIGLSSDALSVAVAVVSDIEKDGGLVVVVSVFSNNHARA